MPRLSESWHRINAVLSSTGPGTKHQQEVLEEPEEHPMEEVQPLPDLASSSFSLDKAVSLEATSSPSASDKTYQELLQRAASDLGIQVEEVRKTSH